MRAQLPDLSAVHGRGRMLLAAGLTGGLLVGVAPGGAAAGAAPSAMSVAAPVSASTSWSGPGSAGVKALTQTMLAAPSPKEWGQFGSAVAIDGGTAVVGEPEGDGSVEDTGLAWVYVKQDETWVLQAKLFAVNGQTYDNFGSSVAISGDTIVVGAPFETADGAAPKDEGTAHVFVRSGSTWTEQAQLFVSEQFSSGQFGGAVVVDGNTIVVGAKLLGTTSPAKEGGAAFVFVRSGVSWAQQARLVSDDGFFDRLGSHVVVDGDTVAAAAPSDSSGGRSQDGAVYIFVRTGSTWARQAKVIAPHAVDRAWLGNALDLDGDTMVAGTGAPPGGSARTLVFVRWGTHWRPQAELVVSGLDHDLIGGLALKGNVVLAGDYYGDAPGCDSCGATYVFTRSGAAWTQKKVLLAPQAQVSEEYGSAVDFDGVTAIIGAYGAVAPGGMIFAGAAYIVER